MRGSDHNCAAGCSILWGAIRRSTQIQIPTVARTQTLFVCRTCGGEALKWQGQCGHCKAWDTLERVTGVRSLGDRLEPAQAAHLETATVTAEALARMSFGLNELDRVFGGGLL